MTARGMVWWVIVLMAIGVAVAVIPVKWVVLNTDLLIYVLVVVVGYFAVYSARHEQYRAPWRAVFRHRLAVAAATILGTYVMIGLLDSIHFRPALENQEADAETQYSGQVLSALDWLVTPLRTQVEKTYSSPLATRLYAKEMMVLPDGQTVRDYPRLAYGGRHLAMEDDRIRDIAVRSGFGMLGGVIVWLILLLVLLAMLARQGRRGLRETMQLMLGGRTEIPWTVALGTLALILAGIGVLVALAPYYHVLGTDKVGQDVLYQNLKSIRTGLVIGTLTTLIMLPFAILLGVMAGHFRGWVDDVIQYFYTTLNSIPGVLLIAAVILSLQVYIANHPDLFETAEQRADLRLLFLCIILGVTSWTGLCRVLRAETLKLREMDYIQAARAFGVSDAGIIRRHIVPNVMHIVLIAVVLDFSSLVLAEAVLSYVGVGVDPTMNSWGNMINSARLEIAREPVVWWSLVSAFWFMFVLVLAANLFADAVRDAFDPRMQGAR